MNDTTMPSVELSVGEILSNGISIGLKNFVSLVLTYIVFLFTIWIPYLNLGTIIATQDIVPRLSRGESISPGFIFDERYRRNFGEYFIMLGLMFAALYMSVIFFVFPAIILGIAWMFSGNLFVDLDTGPIESLRLSNAITHGNKLTIFLAFFVFGIGVFVIQLLLSLPRSKGLMILSVIVDILIAPLVLGMCAHIYGRLLSAYNSDASGAEPADPSPVGA